MKEAFTRKDFQKGPYLAMVKSGEVYFGGTTNG